MAIAILFLFTTLNAGLVWFFKSRLFNLFSLFGSSALYLAVTAFLYHHPSRFTAYFASDPLNLVFLTMLSFIFLSVSIYTLFYFKVKKVELERQNQYTLFLLLFVAAMTAVILTTHLALLWVFIEATTLMSAPFIYFERNKLALEATWKYLFICSLGITLAFMGILLLSISTGKLNSLFFDDLYKNAAFFQPFWLKVGFLFMLVGFGTKSGLAPVHASLPDSYSESPTPITAMLAGMLINTAFLGIMRIHKIVTLTDTTQPKTLLLLMGFFSLFVAAVYMLNTKNYKRMLAYSSIENMGIAAIALSLGGNGSYAAIFMVFGHSLTKTAFFLTSGNILTHYKSKQIESVKGLLLKDRRTAWLWLLSFVALAGFPPFPIFFGKLYLLIEMIRQEHYALFALYAFLVLIILWGMAKTVLEMCYSLPEKDEIIKPEDLPLSAYIPQMILLLVLILAGLSVIPDFSAVLKNASVFLQKGMA